MEVFRRKHLRFLCIYLPDLRASFSRRKYRLAQIKPFFCYLDSNLVLYCFIKNQLMNKTPRGIVFGITFIIAFRRLSWFRANH